MSRFLSRFTAISLKTYSTNQMATKRKASAKKQANRADNEENRVLQWVKSEPPRAIEMGTLLSVLTEGWDWSKAIGVSSDTSNGQRHFKEVPINSPIKINTSKGRLYGEFFGEDESPVACILEGFEYPPGKPVVCKEGPKGVAIIEGKGSFIVQQARIKDPNGPTSLLKSGKLAKPVVIGSTTYQFAAFSLSWNAIKSNFCLRVVCFANELPDRILPIEKDRLNYFCIWLNQWWGKHFDEIVQKKRDEKKKLMAECYNPEGIDPWENQCEVLRNLMVEDYPKLFAAWEMLKNAKTEHAREDARQKARLAFIAEWKAVTGTPPSWVDDRGFSQDDDFIELLFNATKKNPGSKSGADKWWLAINWTGKKLLIMKPKQLAECYFQETGQNVSGDTLARYSRDIGLKNMRKQGPTGVRNK